MRISGVLVALAVVSAGCVLRPHYGELMQSQPAAGARFVLRDADTRAPLGGVAIELGEGRGRVKVTTAADGTFELPRSAPLLKDNPMLVVTLPAGVRGYTWEAALPAPVEAPVAAPVAQPEAEAPAGVPATEEAVKTDAPPPSEDPVSDAGAGPVSL